METTTTQMEISGRTKDGINFVSVKINPINTGRFIEYLRNRITKPFSITINAGLREDGSPYDFIELDSVSTGEQHIDGIVTGFPV